MSTTATPGVGKMFLPAFPKVKGFGSENALTLNHSWAVRWLAGLFRLWPRTILGRFGVPVFAKSVPKYQGFSGEPSWKVRIPEAPQLDNSARRKCVLPKL